jgi:hypothetical protein
MARRSGNEAAGRGGAVVAAVAVQETYFVAARGSPEWDAAWRSLGCALVDCVLGSPLDLAQACNGEVWEYLHSERPQGRDYLVHQFRHQGHPVTQRREVLRAVSPVP